MGDKHFSFLKWIAGVLATVISGVLIWWLTEGVRQKSDTVQEVVTPKVIAGSTAKKMQNTFISPVDPYLFNIIKKDSRSRGAWIVPLGQVNMTNYNLVLAWPAFTPDGAIIDNNAFGFMFEQKRGMVAINDIDKIYGKLQEYIHKKAGDKRFYVYNRRAGAKLNQLGPLIEKYANEFVKARQIGNYNEATKAAASFSRLFSFDIINNPMTNLLIDVLEFGGLEYSAGETPGSRSLNFRFSAEGKSANITMTAGPIEGSNDKWVIESFRRAR